MASKFPHVQFIGMDLAPAILSEYTIPDNCRFELGDVNRGLPHYHGQFDLIHIRQLGAGVSPRHRVPIRQTPFWSILCRTFSTTV